MVWIYGGGFAAGMTRIPAYDGTRLAEKGVVLVTRRVSRRRARLPRFARAHS